MSKGVGFGRRPSLFALWHQAGGPRSQAILQTLFVSVTKSFDERGFKALNIEHFSVLADVCGKIAGL